MTTTSLFIQVTWFFVSTDDPSKPFLCKGFAEATFGRGDCITEDDSIDLRQTAIEDDDI